MFSRTVGEVYAPIVSMFFTLPLLVTTLYGSRHLLRIICVLTLLLQEAGYYLSSLVSMDA